MATGYDADVAQAPLLRHPDQASQEINQATAARPQGALVMFDRPYLMLVTDAATGEPLFMARVADPAAH